MLQPRIRQLASAHTWQDCQASIFRLARSYASVQYTPGVSTSAADGSPTSASTKRSGHESTFMRRYKPRTPGVRHLRRPINDHLWRGRAYLPLTFPKKGQNDVVEESERTYITRRLKAFCSERHLVISWNWSSSINPNFPCRPGAP